MRQVILAGLFVWLTVPGECASAQNRCGIPQGATVLPGQHTASGYQFEYASWYEAPRPNLVTIGHCIALPSANDPPVWFEWPRAGFKGHTNSRTGRFRSVVPISFPPAPQPYDPETNFWHGPRPDHLRVELYDFDPNDDPLIAYLDANADTSVLLAAADVKQDVHRGGSLFPTLRSVCEFSIPVSDFAGVRFADVVFSFESEVLRIAAISGDAEPQWLYLYTWSNVAPYQEDHAPGEDIGRVRLPNRIAALLEAAELEQQRFGPERAVAPNQFADSALLSSEPDQRTRFTAAYFHTQPPVVERTAIRIEDYAEGVERPKGNESVVPVATYAPGTEPGFQF